MDLEFAAIVDELLAAVSATPGQSEAVPVANGNASDEAAAPAIVAADGNSLPPALPLALPALPVMDAARMPGPGPSTDLAPGAVAVNDMLASSRSRPLAAAEGMAGARQGSPGDSAAALAADGAVIEPASAQPITPSVQAGRESPGRAADEPAARPATTVPASAPQEAALVASAPGAHASPSAPAAATRALEVPVPVRDHGWGEALGNRVAWLANQHIQSAELHLNPPQLGPIDVQIRMADNQASIEFGAHHALVREAIESALPKLREMFAAQGLNLADVNVSQQSFAHPRQHPASGQAAASAERGPAPAHAAALPGAAERVLGLVDLYA